MTHTLRTRGVKIPNDPVFISNKIGRSIREDRYEVEEVLAIPKFIKPDDRVIELGAGIGFISSFLAIELGVKKILCVEADPNLCAFIEKVHKLNGIKGVQVRNCVALNGQATPEMMKFFVREQFWSSSLDDDSPYVSVVNVPAVKLSALIQEFNANVLIIDIEGGERDLFEGTDLTGVNKIFLEVHTRKIKRIGIKHCFDALSAAGFAYDQQVSRGGAVLFNRIPKWQLKQ